jgi:hypothetical protein
MAGHWQGVPRRFFTPQRFAFEKSPEGLPFLSDPSPAAPEPTPIVYNALWLPGGRSLLFSAASDPTGASNFDYNVYRVDLPSGAIEQLTNLKRGNRWTRLLRRWPPSSGPSRSQVLRPRDKLASTQTVTVAVRVNSTITVVISPSHQRPRSHSRWISGVMAGSRHSRDLHVVIA